MKSYEQMARDVLRRRDMELKHKRGGKWRSAFRGSRARGEKGANARFSFGAPYAAAGLAIAVMIGTVVAVQSKNQPNEVHTQGGYIHPVVDTSSPNEVVSMTSDAGPFLIDYTNPNVGQTNIVWLSAEKPSAGDDIELDEKDFRERTLEVLDSYYRLRFNRLGEVYTDWKLSYDKLGDYRREIEKPGAVGMEIYYTRNTLNYTTESGAKVTVSAQRTKFEPISDERLTADKPVVRPKPETHTVYDKDGNAIGEAVAGYDPYATVSVGPAPTPTPDEGVSTVNGYEALIYRLSDGSFLADLDMNSRVRITAEGVSDEKFLEILDNFTK